MRRALALFLATLTLAISLVGKGTAMPSCPAAPLAAANQAQVDAGKRIFLRCIACHEVGRGPSSRIGPNLGFMFDGRPLAAEGYNYSRAFRDAAPNWRNREKLDAFLARPSAAIPGTKMVFAGIASAPDRAKLIAYLQREARLARCQ